MEKKEKERERDVGSWQLGTFFRVLCAAPNGLFFALTAYSMTRGK